MSIRRRATAVVAVALTAGLLATPTVGSAEPGRGSASAPGLPRIDLDPAGLARRTAPGETAASPETGRRPAGRAPAATIGTTYTDTCHDTDGDALDVRRVSVRVNETVATFSATFCGITERSGLEAFGTRLLRWRTAAGDGGGVRHLDLDHDGTEFRLTVYEVDDNGDPVDPPLQPPQPVDAIRGPDATTPVPRLEVTVDRSWLRLRSGCDPNVQAGCLYVSAASFPTEADADADDMLPEPDDTQPLRWPSDCNASVSPDSAVVHTRPGAAARLAHDLRAAGYPASVRTAGVVDLRAGTSGELRAALRDRDDVRAITRPVTKHRDAVVPDDELYDQQWPLPRLGLPDAWETTTGSASVRIGILDDGVDAARTEFSGGARVAAGWDAVRASGFDDPTGPDAVAAATIAAGTDSDLGSHGTSVAALAAGTGGDGTGMAGVDWRAAVVPIRVMDHEGCISEAAYLEGLRWARDHGRLHLLNVSLGGAEIPGTADEPGEADYVDGLLAAGTLVVASMGNEAERAGIYRSYPAALDEVIAVGAIGPDDRVAGYSNFGRHVDVAAPGGNQSGAAEQDVLTATDVTLDGSTYTPLAGTSFATPLVTGLGSLYLAAQGPEDTTPADVVRALLASADDLGDVGQAGFDTATGFGVPDATRLLTVTPGQLTSRLGGADRYATAVTAALRAFPDPALVDTVLLATGTSFPDALAGGPLAAREHAPLLLATPEVVPAATMQALQHFGPDLVLLLGGRAALGEGVRTQLENAGYSVDRVAGSGRYDTAARIAAGNAYAFTGAPGQPVPAPTTWDYWSASDVVYVATGEAFPDALAGGAAAAANGAPLLLTPRETLADATRTALERLSPSQVVVLGGTAAVTDRVAAEIAALPSVTKVARASGPDRYATAAAAVCPASLLCIRDTRYVLVATGTNFADALGGTAAAAAMRAPLLLVPPSGAVPSTVLAATEQLAPEHAVVLGGTAAVAPDVEATIGARVVR